MIELGPDFRVPPNVTQLQVIVLVLVLVTIVGRVEADAQLGILRARARYTLTSWFRTPERNAQVGGSPNSLHPRGLAIDVAVDTPLLAGSSDAIERIALVRAWQRLGRPFQAVDEGDHVHLEFDES